MHTLDRQFQASQESQLDLAMVLIESLTLITENQQKNIDFMVWMVERNQADVVC